MLGAFIFDIDGDGIPGIGVGADDDGGMALCDIPGIAACDAVGDVGIGVAVGYVLGDGCECVVVGIGEFGNAEFGCV